MRCPLAAARSDRDQSVPGEPDLEYQMYCFGFDIVRSRQIS